MSIPVNELVYAGIWNVANYYNKFQFVQSPTDNVNYVYVGETVIIGGGDPATVQPSPIWIPFPVISAPFTPAYCSFSASGSQAINPLFPVVAPLTLRYDTQDIIPQGIAVVLPVSEELEVTLGGVYKVVASVQLDRTMGGNSEIDMYPAVNGTAVPNSATKLNINQNEESVMTVEWFLQLNANDRVSIVLFSLNAGNQALGVPANPPVPAIPSIITTIVRIA